MEKTRVIIKNDGHGHWSVLPIPETEIPDLSGRDTRTEHAFWRRITAQYRSPCDVVGHTFYAQAKVKVYYSGTGNTGNYWIVQELGHKVNLLRFAIRGYDGQAHGVRPEPCVTMPPDVARHAIESWEACDMPEFIPYRKGKRFYTFWLCDVQAWLEADPSLCRWIRIANAQHTDKPFCDVSVSLGRRLAKYLARKGHAVTWLFPA